MIGSGIGKFTIGGFDDSDSLSTENPLLSIITSNQVKREYLLRAEFPTNLISDEDEILITDDELSISIDGIPQVDLSTGGYVSKPYDDPYKLFPGCISTAYSFSTELSPSEFLSGGAGMSGGEIKIKNAGKRFDSIATMDWLGADLKIFIGTMDYALTEFTNFSRGVSSGVNKQFDSFSILQKDHRFKLKNTLQNHRYMGTDSCIRSTVATPCTVDFGDILDKGVDSFTIQILFKAITPSSLMYLMAKRNTGVGLSISVNNDGSANITLSDGTNTSVIISDITEYLDYRMHRLSLVINRNSEIQTLFVDGINLGIESISSLGSISNSLHLILGGRSDLSSPWVGYYDDFQVWNVALTQDQIKSNMHRELRPTEVESDDLDIYVPFNERDGLSAFDMRDGSSFVGTLSDINGWSGSLEGTSSIARNVKPILVGIKRNIEPILVDPFGLVYQWHDEFGEEILDVTIAGDAFAFQSEVSDMYDATPDPDKFTVYRGSDGSYFKLGSNPSGEVLFSAKGDASLTGYVSTMPTIHKRIITKWGKIDSSQLNLSSYIGLELQSTANVGFYFKDEIKCDEALDIIVKSGGFGWWGPNRLGMFTIGRIENPDEIVPEVNLSPSDFIDPNKGGTFSIQPLNVKIGKFILGYRRYGKTLTVDQLSGSLTQDQIEDKGSEYRFVEAGISGDNDDTVTIYTEIDSEEDAQLEVNRMLLIWNKNRFVGRFTLKNGILQYFIGSPFIANNGRYELAVAKKTICFGVSESLGVAGVPDRLDVALFF